MVVRSDGVVGNEVLGEAWLPDDGGTRHRFVARFTDDGELIDCRVDATSA